jgi:hypothetical protein
VLQLPDDFTERPWTFRAKQGEEGVPSASERRGPLWRRPHHGVLAWVGSDEDDPRQRILAASAAVDGLPLAGWAAAYLHGATELDGQANDGTALPVLFCPGTSGARRPRPGLQPWRSTLEPRDVVQIDRIPCTSLNRTAFDLARQADSLHDAVADLDVMLRSTKLSQPDLAKYIERQGRRWGVVQARGALMLLDPFALSRPESRLRVLWVEDAGLPRPLVNAAVYDKVSGRRIGAPDLLDPESGLASEYDGDYHWELGQSTADNRRQERLESLGLTIVRVTALDMHDPATLVQRLQEGYVRARRVRRRNWWVPRGGK